MRKGFTLIELIAVIAIIGILGTIGYQLMAKAMAKAKAAQLESQLKQIQAGLAKYYKDMGTFPYYMDYLIKKPDASSYSGNVGEGGWDSFSAATGAGDDPDLVEYWGGPYVDGMKLSPDVQHCLLSTLGGPICFGAMMKNDTNTSANFSNPGQMINYPFAGDGNPTIAQGKLSHGYDNDSDAYFNVLQIAEVPKDIAIYIYKDMNGNNPPPSGNLVKAALGESGGDPTMFIGVPDLKKYSISNRIIYRYFRLY